MYTVRYLHPVLHSPVQYSVYIVQYWCTLHSTYIQYCILLLLLLLLRVLDPPRQVVHEDELDEGGVDEEHADPVPEVHGGQVGDHGELGAEPGENGENFKMKTMQICVFCVGLSLVVLWTYDLGTGDYV